MEKINWHYVAWVMIHGGRRRKEILKYLIPSDNCDGKILVNRKYCLQTKYDKDLQMLIKQGKVYLVNLIESRGCFFNKYSTKRQPFTRNYIVSSEYYTRVGIRRIND